MRDLCELAIEQVVPVIASDGEERLFQIDGTATLDDGTQQKIVYKGNWVDSNMSDDIFVAIDQKGNAVEIKT